MMTFSSSPDLSRLSSTNPAHPVISTLISNLNTDPVTITLLQPHDADHPLAELCNAEDVSLEGIIEQGGMFLIVLQTDYQYGMVFVVPDAEWLNGHLRLCIEENLYN